ncbi:TonB-dependent siderophore receptor [Spongiibacter sp. KMU-166]|uniref:TonB-dependent siderophore receptor n=1 Tax=Spongiibacter thalassae TaxID=2721624 RepID=A0ABX1GJ66_9GAMM|nr:TonB-dependent siderophore receptor [Spongiibacter thalassae]NKI18518.1 TonB-dependent siderophore receptor [Spongiibacter thalassae]
MTDNTATALSLRKRRFRAAHSAFTMGSILITGSALAQQAADEPFELDTLQVEERTLDTNPYAEPGAPYKARISGDRRHVKALADTPQTIQVLTQVQIQESGRADLKDILAAQPGITLGTGENGNAFGDRYVIRGHEARSDVFVDGLRDPGMTTRESFAVEQIEITKGPSSTFAGRGSTGGAVNSITKQASTDYSFNKIEAGLGTDNYRRVTLDSNQPVSDTTAVRVNVLHAYEDVPDRAPADRERNGTAISATTQASERLDITADAYYLSADDQPDLGSYIDGSTGKANDAIPVYSQNEDFLESDVQTLTLRVGYTFNDALRLENATRYGTTENGYVVTGARGTNRDASDPDAPGAATISLSTHQGWQEVDYFVNQLNLYWNTELAGQQHQWLFSAEYSQHDVINGNYNVTNNGATNCVVSGRGGPRDSYCIIDPSGNEVSNINTLMGRQISRGDADVDYSIDTVSLAVMDTIDLSEYWSVFLGLRLDSFDYSNTVNSRGVVSDYTYSDELWNGHIGLVYNINEDANVYLTYSSSANINGGESDVGGNCGYGGLCGSSDVVDQSKPEQTENLELGTKWNILDNKLLASAAVFQITKDDVMEGADYDTTGTLNTGKNRVDGVEVSLVGNITPRLSTQFGAALMNAKILNSVDPANEGKTLANFADKSLFLQLRYQPVDAFSVGATATYSSEAFVGQPDSAANEERSVPSYTVFDLFASYRFNEQLSTRLNIGNVSDEDYYLTAYRSGSFAYIGDRRNAQLSVQYEF